VVPPEDRAIWATASYAGLRRGKLQALPCMDVDLRANLIHVRKGWDQIEGEIEPKDRIFRRSAREVFYASTVDGRVKRAWRAHNAAEREAAAEQGREPELLTLLTMHECRHTFASLLIETGANPKAIQEVMGHSKIQTTLDVYGHLLPGSYDDA
jgi:integrase